MQGINFCPLLKGLIKVKFVFICHVEPAKRLQVLENKSENKYFTDRGKSPVNATRSSRHPVKAGRGVTENLSMGDRFSVANDRFCSGCNPGRDKNLSTVIYLRGEQERDNVSYRYI